MARYAAVTLLRRVLYLQALAAAIPAVGLVALPRWVLVTLLAQPGYVDYAWVRVVGVQALGLAMVIVLVAQRIEDLWWWSWAFVVGTGAVAAVTTLHAAFGVPAGAAAWPWWAVALGSWAFGAAQLWGIGRAGLERPAL